MNKPIETHVSDAAGADPRLVPYAKPQPWGMVPDMVINEAMEQDEHLWAPVAADIWSRPLHLNVSNGYYVHLLRVKRAGILQRHDHRRLAVHRRLEQRRQGGEVAVGIEGQYRQRGGGEHHRIAGLAHGLATGEEKKIAPRGAVEGGFCRRGGIQRRAHGPQQGTVDHREGPQRRQCDDSRRGQCFGE